MSDGNPTHDMIEDYLTGGKIPNIGAEMNRQAVVRFLVEQKGYDKTDLTAGVEIALNIAGETYRSRLDLVVRAKDAFAMVIKCVAGSPGSREREVLASARVLDRNSQIPFSVVADGKTAIVLDTVSGKRLWVGMDMIPGKERVMEILEDRESVLLEPERREREKIIFRSYDMDNVNRLWET